MTVDRALPPLVVIAGATATGKTSLSLALARSIPGAEIISADSRQVYRGMDIGTAKVGPTDRAEIPHHGLDLVEPDAAFSVADFADHAAAALSAIAARGGVAFLVGGTGLYLRAVARGVPFGSLGADPAVRAQIEDELRRDGLGRAVEHLVELAPSRAAAIDLRNPRRVARALEIAVLHGDVAPPAPRGYGGDVLWLGLRLDRELRSRWIAERARGQFDAGLVDEAAALRAKFDETLPSFSAIGYREAFAVLDGRLTREEAIAEDARRNVLFARRQATWFRAEPGITWLDAAEEPYVTALPLVEAFLERATAEPTVPLPAS